MVACPRIRLAVLGLALLTLIPSLAVAQTANFHKGTWMYGLSAGAGRRSTSGTFHPADLPISAGQPPAVDTIGMFGITGGVAAARRVAVLAVLEQGAASETDRGRWGAIGLYGATRVWLVPRVWVEGGVGTLTLGYRLPSATGMNGITRWWAPSPEAAVGAVLLRGQHIALGVLGRYSTATFDGLTITHVFGQVELFGWQ